MHLPEKGYRQAMGRPSYHSVRSIVISFVVEAGPLKRECAHQCVASNSQYYYDLDLHFASKKDVSLSQGLSDEK